MKLQKSFYTRDTLTVAKELLGKVLVCNNCKVRINETEAYIGSVDKAAHCYKNKVTKRTEIMFREGGHAYVYLIYGMYHCFNIVTEKAGQGAAVLIRSGLPISNEAEMFINRYNIPREMTNIYQKRNLLNGPGKLCKALNITKKHNGVSLLGDEIYLEDDGYRVKHIKKSKRIGIDYAEEAKDFLWRFYY